MQGISFFESITFIVGLSISYLFLVGISTNSLVFIPYMFQPLNKLNSLIVLDVYTVILLFINYLKENKSLLYIIMPKVSFVHLPFYIISFFFPVLSIGGVLLLDRNGVNTLTMILLFSIAFYVLLVTIFTKKLEQFHFEIPLYLIAISVLFMFSLRSSYIIGWDIYTEYKVFLITETHQLWSMANYPDAYNACLSITILPTLFHYFTKVENAFVFKILFQCMFAFTSIIIYSLAKKFANCLTAFLSTFFFMSTLDFFRELPALVRQETAYIFFGLILLTLFSKQIVPLQKKILFVIFSFSIVLSHYSTAYILIALFGFACICLTIHKKVCKQFFHVLTEDFTLKPLPVILFITFAYIWLGIITNTSGNAINAFIQTGTNITHSEQRTLNTSIFDQLFSPSEENPQVLLAQEINDASTKYKKNNLIYYPKSAYKGYTPTIIKNDILPLHVSVLTNNIINFVGSSAVRIMKLFIILGFIAIIILFRKRFFSAEYTILSIGFAIALILITSVPVISLFYPLGRLDQQAFFLVAAPSILAVSWLLRFIPYRIKMILIAVLFITYSLFTNTFISQLTGGQDPEVFLNNSGRYYNEVYLHSSEVASIQWLSTNNKENLSVFADVGSTEKMTGYDGQKSTTTIIDVFPSLIDKNGLVYSNYANTLHGIGITSLKDTRMEFNFPNEFLNNNKNLIYSNYDTQIYK